MEISIFPDEKYRKALAEAWDRYNIGALDLKTQTLFRRIFAEGWKASKQHTFDILDSIADKEKPDEPKH